MCVFVCVCVHACMHACILDGVTKIHLSIKCYLLVSVVCHSCGIQCHRYNVFVADCCNDCADLRRASSSHEACDA